MHLKTQPYFGVVSTKTLVATAFVGNFLTASVRMLSGTDALFVNPKDELAAWTLKFKLPELLAGLFI